MARRNWRHLKNKFPDLLNRKKRIKNEKVLPVFQEGLLINQMF